LKIHITITDDKKNQFEGEAELVKVKSKSKTKKNKPIQVSKPPTATSAIRQLYSENYFKNKKTLSVVIRKLSSKDFNFGESHIFNALNRAKYLQRKGNRGSYAFIHKYSPNQ